VDHKRARIAVFAFAGCCVALGVANAATDFPIRAMRWVAPGANVARILSEKPSECLSLPATSEAVYSVEIGRAAFNTPLVLGGQASRAGLQCESCHRGGRTNPQFFFTGISGAPGTADVTSSLFSSHRGDGIDNPKPIPDLSGPRNRLKVSRNPQSPELRTFIRGLVTKEFDGAEPPPAVLDGLASYVRALTPQACPENPLQPVRMQSVMADAVRAAKAANGALAHKDAATAILMVASARTQLGLVYERYAAPTLAREQTALHAADLDLASIQDDIRSRKPDVATRLLVWIAQADNLTKLLTPRRDQSLFDLKALTALIASRTTPGAR
jgi:hypothetical protein